MFEKQRVSKLTEGKLPVQKRKEGAEEAVSRTKYRARPSSHGKKTPHLSSKETEGSHLMVSISSIKDQRRREEEWVPGRAQNEAERVKVILRQEKQSAGNHDGPVRSVVTI